MEASKPGSTRVRRPSEERAFQSSALKADTEGDRQIGKAKAKMFCDG